MVGDQYAQIDAAWLDPTSRLRRRLPVMGPEVGPKLVPSGATDTQFSASDAQRPLLIPAATTVTSSLAVWGSGVRAPQLPQHSSGVAGKPRRHPGLPLGSRSRTQAGTAITMSGKERPGPSLPREPGGMHSCYVGVLRERNTPQPRTTCVQCWSPSGRAASRAHSGWELMLGEVGWSEPAPPMATRTRCRAAAQRSSGGLLARVDSSNRHS
jgi:hypothetical protein